MTYRGSEQEGLRPCLVIQTDCLNVSGIATTIVCPLTKYDNKKNIDNLNILIKKSDLKSLSINSILKIHQLRVIDISRIVKKIGKITDIHLQDHILDGLSLMFDLDYFK